MAITASSMDPDVGVAIYDDDVFEALEQHRTKCRDKMKPDFDSMSKEDCVELLKKIRNSLIGCEDAGDGVLYIAELLSVDMKADAENDPS